MKCKIIMVLVVASSADPEAADTIAAMKERYAAREIPVYAKRVDDFASLASFLDGALETYPELKTAESVGLYLGYHANGATTLHSKDAIVKTILKLLHKTNLRKICVLACGYAKATPVDDPQGQKNSYTLAGAGLTGLCTRITEFVKDQSLLSGKTLQSLRKYLHTKLVYKFNNEGDVQIGSLVEYTESGELTSILKALGEDPEKPVFRLTPLN